MYNPLYLSELKWQVAWLVLIPLLTCLPKRMPEEALGMRRAQKAFLLFLCAAFLSALCAQILEISVRSFLHYCALYGAFCAGFFVLRKNDTRLLFNCVIASALLSVVGVVAFSGQVSVLNLTMPRTPVFFANKIFFAAFLTFVLPLPFVRIWSARSRFSRIGNVCVFCALLLTILHIGSRSYWIITCIVLTTDLIIMSRIKPARTWSVMRVGIMCVVIVSLYVYTDPGVMIARVRSLFDLSDVSVMTRLLLLKTARDIFFSHIFIGIGPGMFQYIQPLFLHLHIAPLELGSYFSIARIGMSEALAASVHNDYLQVAVSTGLLGVGTFLTLLFQALARSYTRFVHEKDDVQRIMRLSVLSALATVVLGGFFNSILHHPVLGLYFFIFLGLACQDEEHRAQPTISGSRLVACGTLFFLLVVLSASDCIGNIYIEKGFNASRHARPKAALRAYKRAQTLKPHDYRIYVNKGNIAFTAGRYAEAISEYSRARTRNPYSANILNSLAVAYASSDEPTKARECFQQAIVYGPFFGGAYRNYGIFLFEQLKYAEARTMFETARVLSHRDSSIARYIAKVEEHISRQNQ